MSKSRGIHNNYTNKCSANSFMMKLKKYRAMWQGIEGSERRRESRGNNWFSNSTSFLVCGDFGWIYVGETKSLFGEWEGESNYWPKRSVSILSDLRSIFPPWIQQSYWKSCHISNPMSGKQIKFSYNVYDYLNYVFS